MLVGVLVGGTGVLVAVLVGVLVGGTGVLVDVLVAVLVGVLVGVSGTAPKFAVPELSKLWAMLVDKSCARIGAEESESSATVML